MSKIIKIEELSFPKSTIQHQGEQYSEIVSTTKLLEELNKQLSDSLYTENKEEDE